jgi:peptide/nickel transport system permease protein
VIGVLLRRLLWSIPVFLVVAVFVFLLVHLAPGDVASRIAGGADADPATIERIRQQLGLYDPIWVQFGRWVESFFTGGMGRSLLTRQTVAAALDDRLEVTVSLTLGALVAALAIGVPAGIVAGSRPGSLVDRVVILTTSLGIAAPSFLVGLIFVLLFSHTLGWLPATSYIPFSDDPIRWLRHITLPSLALGVAMAAELARHLRASLRDTLHQDYIRTAIAKGLPRRVVILKHALKNAGIPVATVLGIQVHNLLGGVIVIETVFGLPGIGRLAISAVFARDYPVIQGIAMLAVLVVLIVNLLVDVAYTYLNPKVRVT